MDELLTEAELAERFGKSLEAMRYLRKVGEAPPHIKIGRAVRYPAAAVTAWIEQRAEAS